MSHSPRSQTRTSLARFAMAAAIVYVSLLLRFSLVHFLGIELPPFITLYPAVMLAAILGGLGPGLLATALSAMGAYFLILSPAHHLPVSQASNAISLTVFTAMGVLISWLAERHQQSQQAIAVYESEKALRETEGLYRNLFSLMEEGFCIIEVIFDGETKAVDYRFIEINGAFEKQTGMRRAVGRTMREIAPSHEEQWFEFYGKVALTGEPAHLVHEAKAIDGFYEVHAYRVGDPAQRRVAVVFSEISDRMREERALREQAQLLDLAHDTIMVRDLDGTIRFWNQGAEEMYGFPSEHAVGQVSHQLLQTAFPQPLPEIEATLLEKGRWEGELTHLAQDGARLVVASRWALRTGQDGQPLGVMEINNDISERKQAEEHTRRLNRVYTVLSDINQTIVREKDSKAMLKSACRIAVEKGKFRMAWIGMIDPESQTLEPIASSGNVDGYLDLVKINLRPPSTETETGPVATCFRTGKHSTCDDIEHQLFRPWRSDALRQGFKSVAAFPLRCEGLMVGVFCLYAGELAFFDDDEIHVLDEMAMDISYALEVNLHEEDRRKADEELRRRTALLEALVESALDCVLVIDDEGKKILQNQRLVDVLKIPPAIAADPDFFPQLEYVKSIMKDPEKFAEKARYLIGHRDEISRDEVELTDGTILDRYSAPVRDKELNYYGRIWTLRDITERRQLEAQFRQAQKMEAIGQLTGGIAHDFNNLLTVILGCSEVIGDETRNDPRIHKMAGMIGDAAQRGADLTHRMLAFARRQALQPTSVNINQLLKSMESFLRRTLSADIELKLILATEDCNAIIDPTELESALLNLCVNARDAMPNGGKLIIESRNTALDGAFADQNPDVTPGQYILITVSDTGCGISQQNLPRVFEPFFTTKEVGKGTGLGLSMVYGFAKQSQGHLKIYSEPDRGTSVKLYLPHATQAAKSSIPAQISLANLKGSEVILLVEDNAPVRDFAKSQLVDLGYRVFEAANGIDALKILADHREIDLLFTDLVMPGGLNGRQLAQQASQNRPGLKVLYCSGYAENAVHHQGWLNNEMQLLSKPYSRLELAGKIRGALG
jgi:PAS domain S-box-containing protein